MIFVPVVEDVKHVQIHGDVVTNGLKKTELKHIVSVCVYGLTLCETLV